jgi:hypothetical protein
VSEAAKRSTESRGVCESPGATAESSSQKKGKYGLRSVSDVLKQGTKIAVFYESEYFSGKIGKHYADWKAPYWYRVEYDDPNEDDEDLQLLPGNCTTDTSNPDRWHRL